jgi:alkylation response protein AidB-like acyl-CoA dehydrogenase
MATRATEIADGFLLGGRKTFIGNANQATILIVFASTSPEKGARGISSFILEKGTPGFTSTEREAMMGLRGADVGDVILDNCRLPHAQLLGQRDRGFHQAMRTLDVTRPTVGAQAIGVAQAAYEASIDFCRNRHVFGRTLAEHQATQFSLADMYVSLHAGRLTVMHAAECFDNNRLPFSKEAAAAKVFATECAGFVVDKAVQLHGGLGYLTRCPVERYYRDARVFRIYEGTSEIQRLVIAKRLLGEGHGCHA